MRVVQPYRIAPRLPRIAEAWVEDDGERL